MSKILITKQFLQRPRELCLLGSIGVLLCQLYMTYTPMMQ
uniref:Uncharacterized protein n=1 Tax=Anguilla anguilla TaxID=7936 RepID=A0A0E9UXF0_ANGAN